MASSSNAGAAGGSSVAKDKQVNEKFEKFKKHG